MYQNMMTGNFDEFAGCDTKPMLSCQDTCSTVASGFSSNCSSPTNRGSNCSTPMMSSYDSLACSTPVMSSYQNVQPYPTAVVNGQIIFPIMPMPFNFPTMMQQSQTSGVTLTSQMQQFPEVQEAQSTTLRNRARRHRQRQRRRAIKEQNAKVAEFNEQKYETKFGMIHFSTSSCDAVSTTGSRSRRNSV